MKLTLYTEGGNLFIHNVMCCNSDVESWLYIILKKKQMKFVRALSMTSYMIASSSLLVQNVSTSNFTVPHLNAKSELHAKLHQDAKNISHQSRKLIFP